MGCRPACWFVSLRPSSQRQGTRWKIHDEIESKSSPSNFNHWTLVCGASFIRFENKIGAMQISKWSHQSPANTTRTCVVEWVYESILSSRNVSTLIVNNTLKCIHCLLMAIEWKIKHGNFVWTFQGTRQFLSRRPTEGDCWDVCTWETTTIES